MDVLTVMVDPRVRNLIGNTEGITDMVCSVTRKKVEFINVECKNVESKWSNYQMVE